MTIHQPVLLQPASGDASLIVTGQEYRNATAGLMSLDPGPPFTAANWGNGTQGYGGVPDAGWSQNANTGSMTVVQRGAGANFSVDVAGGWAFVAGSHVSSQGVYACWNDATVNVATPSAPASGTRVHRLILQVQDHLNNGAYAAGTYQAQFVLLQDTGSGTPNCGDDGTTLALISIASGQASVTNANITDYRRSVGSVVAVKTGDQGKTGTSLAPDADLQLWGLQGNATYAITGEIFYNGGTGGAESDLKFTFNTAASGSGGRMLNDYWATNGALAHQSNGWGSTQTAQTTGTSNDMVIKIGGSYSTGGSPPNNFLQFQWACGTSTGTATTIRAASYLRAVRIS